MTTVALWFSAPGRAHIVLHGHGQAHWPAPDGLTSDSLIVTNYDYPLMPTLTPTRAEREAAHRSGKALAPRRAPDFAIGTMVLGSVRAHPCDGDTLDVEADEPPAFSISLDGRLPFQVIGSASSLAEAIACAESTPHVSFGNWGGLEWDLDAAYARREPEEALVLAWRVGDEMETKVLSRSGFYFFALEASGEDTCQGLGMDDPDGPGLWHYANGEGSFSGDGIYDDFDNEFSAEIRPASDADLEKWGFDRASAIEEAAANMTAAPPAAAEEALAAARSETGAVGPRR